MLRSLLSLRHRVTVTSPSLSRHRVTSPCPSLRVTIRPTANRTLVSMAMQAFVLFYPIVPSLSQSRVNTAHDKHGTARHTRDKRGGIMSANGPLAQDQFIDAQHSFNSFQLPAAHHGDVGGIGGDNSQFLGSSPQQPNRLSYGTSLAPAWRTYMPADDPGHGAQPFVCPSQPLQVLAGMSVLTIYGGGPRTAN